MIESKHYQTEEFIHAGEMPGSTLTFMSFAISEDEGRFVHVPCYAWLLDV